MHNLILNSQRECPRTSASRSTEANFYRSHSLFTGFVHPRTMAARVKRCPAPKGQREQKAVMRLLLPRSQAEQPANKRRSFVGMSFQFCRNKW
jgi:hypothetical protein